MIGMKNEANPNPPPPADPAAQRFAALWEHPAFAVHVCGPDGRTIRVNQGYIDLWGLTTEQWQSNNTSILDSPYFADVRSYLERAFAGEPLTLPPRLYSPSEIPTLRGGIERWIQTQLLPVHDESGALREVLALHEDLTERIQEAAQLERRAAERSRELSTLLEVSRNVASMLELSPLLSLILEQLKTVVEYDAAAVFWLKGKDEMRLLNYVGPIPYEQLEWRWSLEPAAHNREIIQTREPVIIDDIHAETPIAQAFRATGITHLGFVPTYIKTWMGVPLLLRNSVIGMLTFDHGVAGFYTPHHAELALAFAHQAAVAIENAQLFEQANRLATLMERQRLARELHDSVSQVLYGIGLGAKTARTWLDRDPQRAAEPLEYVHSLAEAGLAEMRALLFELRPESLQTEGVVAALIKQTDALRVRHGLNVETILPDEPMLPLEIKETLYRVAQEALHNIVKHAGATLVCVCLEAQSSKVVLEIRDNGVGFDPAGAYPGHLGLHSMRERVALAGGVLTIVSDAQGTILRAHIPLRRR
jgi:PAS domain S-box-containing protein